MGVGETPRNGAPQAPPLYVLSHLLLEKPLLLKSLGYHKKLGLGAKEAKTVGRLLGLRGSALSQIFKLGDTMLNSILDEGREGFQF